MFDGLSDKEKEVWGSVVNRVKAEEGDEHAAVLRANDAVREMRAEHFVSYPNHSGDVTITRFGVEDADKGIMMAMNGNTVVEYYFDRRAPHHWNEQNAQEWYGKRYGGFACMADLAVRIDDADLPEKVRKAKENLAASGKVDPFIRRLALTTGNFTVGNGLKLKLTQDFYDRFGPEYEGKPVYKGHHGFGDTDHRPMIGRILAYQKVGNSPHLWIYLYDTETITAIRENEALGIEDDDDVPFGQFSIEAYLMEGVDHKDGYKEPVKLYRKGKGIALVNVAGATGTRVERIAAKQEDNSMSTDTDKKISEATVDELMAHEKFGEAFAAHAEKMAGEEFNAENPVVNILTNLAKNHMDRTNALITQVNEGMVNYLNQEALRSKVLESATAEEISAMAAFGEAVRALPVDQIKELPGFGDAVRAMGESDWENIPAFKEALAAKGGGDAAGMQAAAIVGDVIKNIFEGKGLVLGAESNSPGGGQKIQEIAAIMAKAKEGAGLVDLPSDEFEKAISAGAVNITAKKAE
ncbi:MAG: hypothetical protein JW885_02870 [Deltaproteobacteria bacterium]|nr:hypothetical protein [Candidatus Zymogenaceae bacterium]